MYCSIFDSGEMPGLILWSEYDPDLKNMANVYNVVEAYKKSAIGSWAYFRIIFIGPEVTVSSQIRLVPCGLVPGGDSQ